MHRATFPVLDRGGTPPLDRLALRLELLAPRARDAPGGLEDGFRLGRLLSNVVCVGESLSRSTSYTSVFEHDDMMTVIHHTHPYIHRYI